MEPKRVFYKIHIDILILYFVLSIHVYISNLYGTFKFNVGNTGHLSETASVPNEWQIQLELNIKASLQNKPKNQGYMKPQFEVL